MTIQEFYSSLADVNLPKDIIADKADLYIQRYIYIGQAVYDVTIPGAAILTPSGTFAPDIDELISTSAANLIIYDDNEKAASVKIDDNDATTITFDEADLFLDEDETTAATLTDTNTYDIYILTPSASNAYGPFWGYTEGNELNITQTFKTFKYGLPKKKIRKDLEEVDGTITGGHVNWSDKDTAQTIFSAEEYGDNTGGKQSIAFGSSFGCGGGEKLYRLSFQGIDVSCRNYNIIVRKVQFGADGNLFNQSEDGYSMVNFNADILSDAFYPEGADMVQIKRGA